MESSTSRNEEKRGSRLSQAATSLGGGSESAPSSPATSLPGYGDGNSCDWDLYFQYSSPTPKAPTPALTETVPAPRHTSCHSPRDKGALPSSFTSGG
ncbi:uncharacterized protein RBU33_013690 isoform 2-T3 [Hipposideros larvatus]